MPASDTRFAYAVGRVRALETRLLDRGKFDRMVDAPLAEEVLKILGETDYAGAVAALASVYEFEKVLREEITRTFWTIYKISPKPHIIALMALQYDIHNLKTLFKAHYLGEDSAALLLGAGTIPPEKLQAMVTEEAFSDLPPGLRAAAERVAGEFAQSRDPQVIDLYLDQVLYDTLVTSAHKAGLPYLESLFVRQIDLLNIKTFLRIKRMGRDRNFLSKALLSHGSLPIALFLELLEEPLELLADRLAMSDYAAVVSEGIREWQSAGTITRFEKLADDFITAYLKDKKNTPFGSEPLIAYLYAKEIEVKNIRLVMVGKINNLPTESVRERLRDVYV